MKTKFFLTFYKSGLPKITKNLAPPSLGAIAVAVEAEIPDTYFTRPAVMAYPRANLTKTTGKF